MLSAGKSPGAVHQPYRFMAIKWHGHWPAVCG